MEKLKRVFVGETGGDCCHDEIYEPIEPITVQELCDYIISDKKEWGYIEIKREWTKFRDRGKLKVEYFHDQYVNEKREPIGNFKFPPQIANSYIEKIDWRGGYGSGNWLITLKDKTVLYTIDEDNPTIQKIKALGFSED